MARKRQAVRIDDTQRDLLIKSPVDSVGTLCISIPDMLMRANRRQYTQCRAYDFRLKVATITETVEHHYDIYTLSNAWWVKRAIEMAKGVYLEATKEERAILGNNKAKYHDFIISTNVGATSIKANLHQFQPSGSNDDIDSNEVAFDESLHETFEVSKLRDDDGNFMGFSVDAEDTTANGHFNIFDQYLLATSVTADADSRAGPYAELTEIDEDAMNDLQQSGDLTPWDADAFPSPWVLADTIAIDQSVGAPMSHYSKRLTAPLGMVLLKKRTASNAEDNFALNEQFLLEAKKGTYRGVHAPAYKAMNGVLGK
jgi:hypothetical protein